MKIPEDIERRAVIYTAAVLRVLSKGFDEDGVRIERIELKPPETVWLEGVAVGVKVYVNAWIDGELLPWPGIHTRVNAQVDEGAGNVVSNEGRVRKWLIDAIRLEAKTKADKE